MSSLKLKQWCWTYSGRCSRRLGAATTQYAADKPASIAQDSATKAGSAFRNDFFGARAAAAAAAVSASLSRFNYLTVKADRPRRAAGGALRLVGRVRSGRTRRQRAAVRLPRSAPDSAAPQRHIAHRAHATLKFRNRRLSRVQLAMTIWPNSVACAESGLQTRGRGPRADEGRPLSARWPRRRHRHHTYENFRYVIGVTIWIFVNRFEIDCKHWRR